MTLKFTGIIFWKKQSVGKNDAKKWRPEGRKGVAHAAWFLGRVGYPIWALVALFASIFLPKASSWPKTDYKNSPPTFSRGERRRNTETTKQRPGVADWSGKTPAGRCRHGLHLLRQLLHRLPDEGGVVHPLDFGFVVVTWSNLSMYDHCWSPYDVPCMSMDLSM